MCLTRWEGRWDSPAAPLPGPAIQFVTPAIHRARQMPLNKGRRD